MAVLTLQTGLNTEYPWHFTILNNTLYATNGYDTPLAWGGQGTSMRRWGIVAPSSAPSAAVGAAGNLNGTYSYKVTFARVENGAIVSESNPSDASGSISPANEKGELSSIPTTTDTQVNRVYIYRNKASNANVYYRLGYVAEGTTTYTDNTADSGLGLIAPFDTDLDSHGEAPYRPYVIGHQGRAILAGEVLHEQGTVSITSGSDTLTGDGADFKEAVDGWAVMVNSETFSNKVSTVDSTSQITMVTNAGVSGSGKRYALTGNERSYIAWSGPLTPEYFNTSDKQAIAQEEGDHITGLYETGGFLAIVKSTHVWSIHTTGDPSDGRLLPVLADRGCCNQRCVVKVDAAVYMLDYYGVHIFSGGSVTHPISQPTANIVRMSDQDRYINWVYASKFHGVHDAQNRRVSFFVVMGSDTEPKDCLSYYYDEGVWAHDTYPQGITASCEGVDNSGVPRSWVADENGYRWVYGQGDSDGADTDYTVRGTATGGGATTLTDSGASFPTDTTYAGVYVWKVASDGTTEQRMIASSTATELTVSAAWDTNPVSGDNYYIGGIPLEWYSKTFDAEEAEADKRWTAVSLSFTPMDADVDLTLNVYVDRSSTAYSDWTMTKDYLASDGYKIAAGSADISIRLSHSDGHVRVPLGFMARYLKLRLYCLETERDIEISGVGLEADYMGHAN